MKVEVGAEADAVGRTVRDRLDRGERVAGFVGDFDTDRDALDAFVADVVRDES